MITKERFIERVGYPPSQDDLERCNCEKAGEIEHLQCGWDVERDMPNFIPSTDNRDEFVVVRDALRQIRSIKTYWDSVPAWKNWEDRITPEIVEKMLAAIDVKTKASK